MDAEHGYSMARQLGALQGAVQLTLEYLNGSEYWNKAAVIKALERALKHDGTEAYYNTTSEQKGEAA